MKFSRSQLPDAQMLLAFEAAARHGSFTRAALELDLTQSAVSRQIGALEARLGLTLFNRIRQRVVLSESGRRLLPEARALIGGIEQMTLRAIGGRDVTGELRLATLPTFGGRWLVPRLPRFLAQHPGIQLQLATRSAPFDLAKDGMDVAIHYGTPAWPEASCHYLCNEAVVPVAAPRIAAGLQRPEAELAEALAAAPLLHMDGRPQLWAQWFARTGADPAAAYRGHRFDQFALLIEAAVAGLGVALAPRYLIEGELAAGRLAEIRAEPMPTEPAYYVVLPDEKLADPLCLAFLDWIRGEVGGPPPAP